MGRNAQFLEIKYIQKINYQLISLPRFSFNKVSTFRLFKAFFVIFQKLHLSFLSYPISLSLTSLRG